MTYRYGFKVLDPTGSTYHARRSKMALCVDDGPECRLERFAGEMVYPLPQPGEKWGQWATHPNVAQPDGGACGEGGMHVWDTLSSMYGPSNWWPWYVRYREEDILGSDGTKTRVSRLSLRRIAPTVLHRVLRRGWGMEACLTRASLHEANLRGADLSGASLTKADLTWANLHKANLTGADLHWANLRWANLTEADLTEANLAGADLTWALLRGADLRGARHNETTLWPKGFAPSEGQ